MASRPTERICRDCGEVTFGSWTTWLTHTGPRGHSRWPMRREVTQLVATAALYESQADLLRPKSDADQAGYATWNLSKHVAEAYAHAAEIVSGEDAHRVERWVGFARARLEAVLEGSTVGEEP